MLVYRTLHLYFRLMAAMFGLPVTPMSESIQLCPIMLMCLKNIGTQRKFGLIAFELWNPIHIRGHCRHLQFLRAWLKIVRYLGHQKICSWFPTDWWELHEKMPIRSGDTGVGAAFASPRRLRSQKKSRRHPRAKKPSPWEIKKVPTEFDCSVGLTGYATDENYWLTWCN